MTRSRRHIWECDSAVNRHPRPTAHAVAAALCILFGAATGCSNDTDREVTTVLFFYEEICPSCDTYQAAERIAGDLAGLNATDRFKADSYNIADPRNRRKLLEALEQRQLPDISRSLPILLVNDRYMVGYDEIREAVDGLDDPEPTRSP